MLHSVLLGLFYWSLNVYLGSKAVCSVPWFWHRLCPSSFHPSRGKKRLRFIALVELILSSNRVDVRTFQRFAGKCISFSYAVPGARLFTNEVHPAISRGLSSSRQLRGAGPLLEEVQHWTFLRSWHGCLPWLKESHGQIQLASDASSFAWGGVLGPYTEPVSIRDYWPLSDLGHNIAVKETLALVNVLEHRHPKLTTREIDRINDLCKRTNDLCKGIEWDVTT